MVFHPQNYYDISKWNTSEYMAAICCAVNLIIMLPLISLYTHKYMKRRNDKKYVRYFQTRNLSLIRLWLATNFYYISIHVIILFIIEFYCSNQNKHSEDCEWKDYFSDFAVISFLFCLFALRVWKLYFDHSFNMSQLDLIWKRQINEMYSNWYLRHKEFGSVKFCFFVILLPFYILINASLYAMSISDYFKVSSQIWYAASFGCVLVILIFVFILGFKLARSNYVDNYGIREEISRSSHIVGLLFIISVISYFIFNNDNIREWIITITMSLGCTSITLISTGGVIYIQNRQETIYKILRNKYNLDSPNGRNQGDNIKQNNHHHNHHNHHNNNAIKLYLEDEFSSNNQHSNYSPLKQHSFSSLDENTENTDNTDNRFNRDPLYVMVSNKDKLTTSMTGGGSSYVGAVSNSGGNSTIITASATDNSYLSTKTGTKYRDRKKQSRRSFSKSIIKAEAQGRLELSQIITNSRLLNVFAQFLCSEFNSENLLFIIEIIQFKRFITENENDSSSILGEYLSIPNDADLPKFDNNILEESKIELKSNDTSASATASNKHKHTSSIDVYLYGLFLLNKYIRNGSSHEINISHRVRRKILKKACDELSINLLNISELQILFDDAFIEILQLLQDPLSRFASWEEFENYLKAISIITYPFFPNCRDYCLNNSNNKNNKLSSCICCCYCYYICCCCQCCSVDKDPIIRRISHGELALLSDKH